MSHPFDATVKDILSLEASDLAPILRLPTHLPSRTLNVDLSTVSAATDVAFGFGEPLEQIVDINFQSGPDAHVDKRMHLYSAALHVRFHVPVRSVLILLRQEAVLSALTGELTYPAGAGEVKFPYEVVRLWQHPVGPFLSGGLGLLPLAPLCQLPAGVSAEQALRQVVQQMAQRLAQEASRERANKLMTAAFVLAGLRLKRATLREAFRGVELMIESSAFEIFEEKGLLRGIEQGMQKGIEQGMQKGIEQGMQKGRLDESHRLLLRLAQRRFNKVDPAMASALRTITDLDRLERMVDAILTANSWEELLATL